MHFLNLDALAEADPLAEANPLNTFQVDAFEAAAPLAAVGEFGQAGALEAIEAQCEGLPDEAWAREPVVLAEIPKEVDEALEKMDLEALKALTDSAGKGQYAHVSLIGYTQYLGGNSEVLKGTILHRWVDHVCKLSANTVDDEVDNKEKATRVLEYLLEAFHAADELPAIRREVPFVVQSDGKLCISQDFIEGLLQYAYDNVYGAVVGFEAVFTCIEKGLIPCFWNDEEYCREAYQNLAYHEIFEVLALWVDAEISAGHAEPHFMYLGIDKKILDYLLETIMDFGALDAFGKYEILLADTLMKLQRYEVMDWGELKAHLSTYDNDGIIYVQGDDDLGATRERLRGAMSDQSSGAHLLVGVVADVIARARFKAFCLSESYLPLEIACTEGSKASVFIKAFNEVDCALKVLFNYIEFIKRDFYKGTSLLQDAAKNGDKSISKEACTALNTMHAAVKQNSSSESKTDASFKALLETVLEKIWAPSSFMPSDGSEPELTQINLKNLAHMLVYGPTALALFTGNVKLLSTGEGKYKSKSDEPCCAVRFQNVLIVCMSSKQEISKQLARVKEAHSIPLHVDKGAEDLDVNVRNVKALIVLAFTAQGVFSRFLNAVDVVRLACVNHCLRDVLLLEAHSAPETQFMCNFKEEGALSNGFCLPVMHALFASSDLSHNAQEPHKQRHCSSAVVSSAVPAVASSELAAVLAVDEGQKRITDFWTTPPPRPSNDLRDAKAARVSRLAPLKAAQQPIESRSGSVSSSELSVAAGATPSLMTEDHRAGVYAAQAARLAQLHSNQQSGLQ